MKKLLTLLLSLPFIMFAQSPQGVGYQGVATDLNGVELINQTISIQASVLSSSATGNIEWQEQHSVTTDAFGLFTLTIGQGTSTGNGAQANFADISWGSATHFLKIEMDVNGGTNYSLMGTNQMMSVPYALYAENANINYDSIATILSNDSSFMISASSGGFGFDIKFPEGLDGEPIFGVTPYTVPTGKRLVLLSTDNNISVNGFTLPDVNYGEVVMLKGSDVLYGPNGPTDFNGILIEPKTEIESIFGVTPYTVPSGKRLVLLSTDNNISVNGFTLPDVNYGEVVMLKGSDVLYGPNGPTDFNGYLADENYFANSGGSGSNSTSSLDSTTIANMIAAAGGGSSASLKFPDGLHGEIINFDITDPLNSYTVPTGKTLYILNVLSESNINEIQINGITQIQGTVNTSTNSNSYVLSNPIIAKSGDVISQLTSGIIAGQKVSFNGYIVDENYFSNSGSGNNSGSNTTYNDSILSGYFGYHKTRYIDGTYPNNNFDTIALPYKEGEMLYIVGENAYPDPSDSITITTSGFEHQTGFNGNQYDGNLYALRIVDDNFNLISAKVRGHCEKVGGSMSQNYYLIDKIYSHDNCNCFSLEVIPQKNSTSTIYIFVEQLLEGSPSNFSYDDDANFYFQY